MAQPAISPPRHYPRCSLSQLLALVWLAALFLSFWAVANNIGRSLLVPAPSARDICVGAIRPIAAVIEGNSYRILDCETHRVLHHGRFAHRLASQNSLDWKLWPNLTPYGGDQNPWLPYGFTDLYSRFSDDDRFLVIRSRAGNSKNHAITLIETSTGKHITWIGEQTGAYFDNVKFDSQQARILVANDVVARLESNAPVATPNGLSADPDVSGLAYWRTEWDTERQYRVSLFAVDKADERDLHAHYLGKDQSQLLVFAGWDRSPPLVIDTQTGEQVDAALFADANSIYCIEEVIDNSFFVYGARHALLSDRLGVDGETVVWNLKDGCTSRLPFWNCTIREHDGRLLVNDYADHQLFWFDPTDGSRETVFHAGQWGYARELVILLWCIAWFFVSRPVAEHDRSRWLGYVAASSVILALAPPLLPVFSPYAIGPGYRWLFALACMAPLVSALLFSAIRKTASIPLLTFGAVALALLVTAWLHFGGVFTSQNSSLASRAWHKLPFDDLDHEFDFFRPWRFGAPKPDDIVHIEFRDTLQTADVQP